jgi:hypothetical protein
MTKKKKSEMVSATEDCGSSLLSENNVIHSPAYRSSDAEAYDLLWGALKDRGVRIDRSRMRLIEKIPTFESFAWRPYDRWIRSNPEGKVSAAQITHQGIHSLISARFGDELRGKPFMTLLNESIGLGLGAYFTAVHIKKNELKPKSFFRNRLKIYAESASLLDVSFRDSLNQFMESPYQGFQRATEDAYFTLKESFLHLRRLRKSEDEACSWAKLTESLVSHPFYFFSHRYSLSVPVHYAAAYCGFSSTREDQRQVQECLNTLRGSQTLVEFLNHIQLGRSISSSRATPTRSYQSKPKLKVRFDHKHLIDSYNLAGADRPVYRFLLSYLISKRIIVNRDKTDLVFHLKKECFHTLPWFFLDSSLCFDFKGMKITSKQVLILSCGLLICEKLEGNKPAMQKVTLLAHTFSHQLIFYFFSIKHGLSKSAAFEQFRENCNLEFKLRQMAFKQSSKVARGESVEVDFMLDESASSKAERILKNPDLAQDTLSVAAQCGFRSCSKDNDYSVKCLKSLSESKSLMDFLSRL